MLRKKKKQTLTVRAPIDIDILALGRLDRLVGLPIHDQEGNVIGAIDKIEGDQWIGHIEVTNRQMRALNKYTKMEVSDNDNR